MAALFDEQINDLTHIKSSENKSKIYGTDADVLTTIAWSKVEALSVAWAGRANSERTWEEV